MLYDQAYESSTVRPVVLSSQHILGALTVKGMAHVVNDSVGTLHTHDFYEFVLVVRGLLIHIVNGIGTILVPGDFFCLAPGDTHVYHHPRNALIYNCMFTYSACEKDIDDLVKLPVIGATLQNERNTYPHKAHLTPAQTQSMAHLMERLIEESEKRLDGSNLVSRSLLMLICAELGRSFRENATEVSPPLSAYTSKFANILEFIHTHLSEEIQVSSLARTANLSEEHFCRLFKRIFGLGPLRYIHQLRISRAMSLLASTDKRIGDIGAECGFADRNYFTRVFKNVSGVPPSVYREAVSGLRIR